MIINISSGNFGWSDYVVNGTKSKPRAKDKVEIIDGDFELGDLLSKNNKYKESYYKIILGFQGKPNDDVIKAAYLDFKREFFTGFEEDEYHVDAIIHKDTDDYHIHVRIPKQNLVTNTHLQLYYDSIDRRRKELLQDYISLKYGFKIARDTNRPIFKENSLAHIQKWRKEHSQKPFEFNKKKNRLSFEKSVNSLIVMLHQENKINKFEDIKIVLEELNLKVERYGKDLKKDFSYVTVSNYSGKMRIKGEIYNKDFWNNDYETRQKQLEFNSKIFQEKEVGQRLIEVRKDLNKENEIRYKKIQDNFLKSRSKALKKINIQRQENDTNRTEIRTRTESIKNEAETFIRRIRKEREFIYQSLESDIEQEQVKQRKIISKSKENFRFVREFSERIREFTDSIRLSTSRISEYAGRINKYAKEILNRFKNTDIFRSIVRR